MKTRFAPSPSGCLHVGGARTALFNWAFAKRHGGKFVLRVEDTDVARSSEDSVREIVGSLEWLGLGWDEGPYYQSDRAGVYAFYLKRLVDCGRAYRCFVDAPDLPEDELLSGGYGYVWKFRMPDSDITVSDEVLGDVTTAQGDLKDFILVKSKEKGGGPTFHFANVVDDIEMGITHVVRAQEHLANTHKHFAIYDALGVCRPRVAHLPLILNSDGTKMSKRDKAKAVRHAASVWLKQNGGDRDGLVALVEGAGLGVIDVGMLSDFLEKKNDDPGVYLLVGEALGVELPEIDVQDFRRSGYLPDVLLNYIALLGWSPGDNVERFDLDFLVERFSLDRIGKTNARFDRAKLTAFNTKAILELPPEQFYSAWVAHIDAYHPRLMELGVEKLKGLASLYQPRVRTLDEAAVNAYVFLDSGLEYSAKARAVIGLGKDDLRDALAALERLADWDCDSIGLCLHGLAEAKNKRIGDIAQLIRAAVAGQTVSPPIHNTLAIMGRSCVLSRLAAAPALL